MVLHRNIEIPACGALFGMLLSSCGKIMIPYDTASKYVNNIARNAEGNAVTIFISFAKIIVVPGGIGMNSISTGVGVPIWLNDTHGDGKGELSTFALTQPTVFYHQCCFTCLTWFDVLYALSPVPMFNFIPTIHILGFTHVTGNFKERKGWFTWNTHRWKCWQWKKNLYLLIVCSNQLECSKSSCVWLTQTVVFAHETFSDYLVERQV